MSATTMVHVRVDKKIKAQATETLSAMGLSMSDAVRVFLTRVVAEQRIPFTLRVPNSGLVLTPANMSKQPLLSVS
ncbi:MAG: type II toxin-antitoxin system RelB/DinJ family antitoxin [Desulfobulbaceae bacterium]|nr:type II toxin-antitoxin system RelB/DinJ family antitoxin [Desulfobulbaceae bacterium]